MFWSVLFLINDFGSGFGWKGQIHEESDRVRFLNFVINDCLVRQCTAEAQEVTIARAIELKHNPSLISSLANETSRNIDTYKIHSTLIL